MLRNAVEQPRRAPNLTPYLPQHITFGEAFDTPSALGEAFRRAHYLPESPLPQRLQRREAAQRPLPETKNRNLVKLSQLPRVLTTARNCRRLNVGSAKKVG